MVLPHLFDRLDYATPRQLCWQHHQDDTREFYFVHDQDNCAKQTCVDQIRLPSCVFVCQCSGCQNEAGLAQETDYARHKNLENHHCLACTCQDCVCDMRRRQNKFSALVINAVNYNCCDSRCVLCGLETSR